MAVGESEFGEIIGCTHGGNIIRRDDGRIVFVSGAFNPLDLGQLTEVLVTLKEHE